MEITLHSSQQVFVLFKGPDIAKIVLRMTTQYTVLLGYYFTVTVHCDNVYEEFLVKARGLAAASGKAVQ